MNAEDVARLLDGKSCAELEAVINSAGRYAAFAGKRYIDVNDIIKACLRVIYNAPESTVPHNQFILKRVAYHEAGHAVVAEILEKDSVNFVTVRKNTGEAGGFTNISLPDEYWFSKTSMENRVCAILAGKAATEIAFGEIDTGVNDDMNRAYSIVKRFTDMYCAYGFGYWTERNLVENKAFLDGIAQRLQQKDTLVHSEIKEIRDKAIGAKTLDVEFKNVWQTD